MNDFDVISVILFVTIGLVGQYLIKKANMIKRFNVYYIVFFLIYVSLATFRKVGEGTGGADAENYIRFFLECNTKNDAINVFEPLWYYYCRTIRLFTSDYRVFFFITYGIIVISFFRFIKEYCPKDIIYSPFVLLMWVFLKDFNTLRTGLAVALFLFALTYIEKRKIVSIILLISSIFIHRMSFIYVVIFIFYYMYKKIFKNVKKIRMAIWVSAFIIISYIMSISLRDYILSYSLFTGVDAYYIRMSIGQSILSRWPMFFEQGLLFICMIIFRNKIKENRELDMVKIFCIFDFIILPASIVLGVWRANEYLYIARLIMWGEIIRCILTMFHIDSRKIVRVSAMCVFILWFLFRLYQEYEEINILPYIFQFENEWKL